MTPLLEPFQKFALENPGQTAVIDPGRECSISYGELEALVDTLANDMERYGADSNQRVGIYASKSIPCLSAILATLKAGSAYVPVDATAPSRRGVEILTECNVRAIVTERSLVDRIREAWGIDLEQKEFQAASELVSRGSDLVLLLCGDVDPTPKDRLSYILYTSGSTGKPKGVMHTHESARCFVDWCSETLLPTPNDRFSSHAPFHFDLSILDLYVPLSHGAAVVLIDEEQGKNPLRLGPLITENEITVWYSTPSILRLLIEYGDLERDHTKSLRFVLFAGEVFAPGHLRRLQSVWRDCRYFNLYGPTETNVCTAYEVIDEVPPARAEPYPIGKPITGDEVIVRQEDGLTVPPNEEGELLVHGGTVMAGYWNRPDLDARVFHIDEEGRRWYRTGDIVRQNMEGDYVFLGRRDRMIKRRGYRVELGEIEATLYRHSNVLETAVITVPSTDNGLCVHAFVCWGNTKRPSTIALKRFCAENLPLYMVPDRFTFLDELPKTSTDKIDYVRLREMRD